MRLFIATAVPRELLGSAGRQFQSDYIIHKGRTDLTKEFKRLCASVKTLVSSREECCKFLKQCRDNGLVPRKLKRWKKGSGGPLYSWEKSRTKFSLRTPTTGPGSQYIKVMVKHGGQK